VDALEPLALLPEPLKGRLGLPQRLLFFVQRGTIDSPLRLIEPALGLGQLGLGVAGGSEGLLGKHRIDPLRGRPRKPKVLLFSLEIGRVEGGSISTRVAPLAT